MNATADQLHEFTFYGVGTNRLRLKSDVNVLMPSEYGLTFGKVMWSMELTGKRVLDVGCGSGILSIIAALQGAEVWATDLSEAAAQLTKENAKINGVDLAFVGVGNVIDEFVEGGNCKKPLFDVVVCNNPSLPGKSHTDLDREGYVQWNENENGRYILDELLSKTRAILAPGGRLLTHSSSEQGWSTTAWKLSQHWDDWQILLLLELPVEGPYYERVRPEWEKLGTIYKKRGNWKHTATIFEAYRDARPTVAEAFVGDKLLSHHMLRRILEI